MERVGKRQRGEGRREGSRERSREEAGRGGKEAERKEGRRKGNREEARKEGRKQRRSREGGREAGRHCQQAAAFPGPLCLPELLPAWQDRLELPHCSTAQGEGFSREGGCEDRYSCIIVPLGMGSACSVPAAWARWTGKSRRCEGTELASQHSDNLGTLSKADFTLLSLGLFQKEEWASNILASILFLHFFFLLRGGREGKGWIVCLFTCTGFAAQSRIAEF